MFANASENQTNPSFHHNNPYPNPHTQQQPYYEHHQGPVALNYVSYPFCNNVAIGGGQVVYVLFQASYQPQPQSQPHPSQWQVGLHNAAHHLQNAPQPYIVLPSYYALQHAPLPQQPSASFITNPLPQHAEVAPSGPIAYVPPAYSHISGGVSVAPTSAKPINLHNVELEVSSQHNTNTNTNTKQRKHAVSIIHPDTLELFPLDAQPKPQPQTQIKSEISVETVTIASDPSDVLPTDTDNIDCQNEIVTTQSLHSGVAATDVNLSIPFTNQQSPAEEASTETDVKSKDEQYTVSVQTSLDRIEEEISKQIHPDLEPPVSSYVVTESKKGRNRNRKGSKGTDKCQKKTKQQQNKSHNSVATQNEEKKSKATLLRYSLEELKAFATSPESCKTPVVPKGQKCGCILQLFVARQQHHHHLLSSQVGQQSYHHKHFNESIVFATGERRLGGGGSGGGSGGVMPRKHQQYHINSASAANNNIAGAGANTTQSQRKTQLIHINLSLNEEIKLSESKNAWQPKFLSNNSNNIGNGNDDIDDVLKKVRGILNKLTCENFDVLVKEITNITINTKEKMQQFMLLIFEKTVSEPNFAPIYAKFSKVLFEDAKAENKKIFNSLLMKRLEKEFELNVNNAGAKERKLQRIVDKLKVTKDQQQKIQLQAELEQQEYPFRRRAWGTVRFIAEMFKLHALSANRVFLYVESLLKHGNEEKLEYMCKLLTTVGNLLESSDNARINKIFKKIQTIVKDARDDSTSSNKKTKICSRVRFMMQDLIDLRSRYWGDQSSYAQPSSHSAALRRRRPEDKSNNLSSLSNYERGSSQRMSFGYNNNRCNQTSVRSKEAGVSGGGGGSNYFRQKSTKTQYSGQREQHHSIDLNKLKFSSSQAPTELGNKSWRTITGRQTNQSSGPQQSDRNASKFPSNRTHQYQQNRQPQPQQQPQYWRRSKTADDNCDIKAILDSCSSKDNQKLLNHLIEEYLDCPSFRSNRWRQEVLNTWQKTNNKQQMCLVYYILVDYLHLSNVKRLERNACALIFIYLMNCKALNKTTFTRAYKQFAEVFPDLLMDVPNGWTYVFQFLGPLLHERLITFSDIWHTNWRNDPSLFTDRFVNALVVYFTKEFGANYMRFLWHKEFKLDRGQQFKSDQKQWHQFVAANKLQFLYDCNAKPELTSTNTSNNSPAIMEQHVQRLEVLLSSSNDSNLALDYINTNVKVNSYFLKILTRFLCCDYATTTKTCSNSSSIKSSSSCAQLNIDTFRKNCLPLLRVCLNDHEDNELACLDFVVDVIQQEFDTYTADELICAIFDIFYDCKVVARKSFEKWLQQKKHKTTKFKYRRLLEKVALAKQKHGRVRS